MNSLYLLNRLSPLNRACNSNLLNFWAEGICSWKHLGSLRRPVDKQRIPTMDTARRRTFLLAPFALFAGLQVGSDSVYAVPSFAIQTSQPCATCHIGSYGPQ